MALIKRMKFGIRTVVGVIAVAATPVLALDMKPVLSLDLAEKMTAACEAEAVTQGWRMNIAITDAGADLIMFKRMDGAFLGSGAIAVNKAKSSSNLPFPTRSMAQMSFGSDAGDASLPGFAFVDGLIAFAGGLPIMAGDVHIGAIGVSGGSEDQDELCAQAAIDAISEALN